MARLSHFACAALLLATIAASGCTHMQPAGSQASTEPQESEDGALAWRGGRRTSTTPMDVKLDWPIDQARLTQGFHAGHHPHWGIDLAGPKGTPILAAEAGVVVYTGSGFHGYGKLIVIEHGPDWATLYSHLSEITAHEGDVVKQGEPIGRMGRTGHATGNHLHFEVRQNRQPVNPLAYLPQGLGPIVNDPNSTDSD